MYAKNGGAARRRFMRYPKKPQGVFKHPPTLGRGLIFLFRASKLAVRTTHKCLNFPGTGAILTGMQTRSVQAPWSSLQWMALARTSRELSCAVSACTCNRRIRCVRTGLPGWFACPSVTPILCTDTRLIPGSLVWLHQNAQCIPRSN